MLRWRRPLAATRSFAALLVLDHFVWIQFFGGTTYRIT
jgi:hypothetical protein